MGMYGDVEVRRGRMGGRPGEASTNQKQAWFSSRVSVCVSVRATAQPDSIALHCTARHCAARVLPQVQTGGRTYFPHQLPITDIHSILDLFICLYS